MSKLIVYKDKLFEVLIS